MKIKCPTCGKLTEYSVDNTFRPFCSERCQTLDLGAWADEQYRVPLSDQLPSTVNENSGHEIAFEEPLPPKHHLT